MALPGTFDLTGDDAVYRGDWYGLRLPFVETDDDGNVVLDVNGDPVPIVLTGRTWRAQIRAGQAIDAALLSTGTVDATDAATGVIVVAFPASETASVTVGSGYWDIEATLVADSENVHTWLRGDVEFEGDASRNS